MIMAGSLFVYGSLMAPEVIRAVIGRVPASCPAVLSGYVRHPVRNQAYPGLIPCQRQQSMDDDDVQGDMESSSTTGLLYKDLSDLEICRLDRFEGDEYSRTTVQVEPMIVTTRATTDSHASDIATGETASHSRSIETEAYVFTNPTSELDTSRLWSFETFKRSHLETFLNHSL